MTVRTESMEAISQETIHLTEEEIRQFEGIGGRLPTGQAVIVMGRVGIGKSTFINLFGEGWGAHSVRSR